MFAGIFVTTVAFSIAVSENSAQLDDGAVTVPPECQPCLDEIEPYAELGFNAVFAGDVKHYDAFCSAFASSIKCLEERPGCSTGDAGMAQDIERALNYICIEAKSVIMKHSDCLATAEWREHFHRCWVKAASPENATDHQKCLDAKEAWKCFRHQNVCDAELGLIYANVFRLITKSELKERYNCILGDLPTETSLPWWATLLLVGGVVTLGLGGIVGVTVFIKRRCSKPDRSDYDNIDVGQHTSTADARSPLR